MAWVSPRLNMLDPCTIGVPPTSAYSGLTLLSPRPSHRLPARICWRTICPSTWFSAVNRSALAGSAPNTEEYFSLTRSPATFLLRASPRDRSLLSRGVREWRMLDVSGVSMERTSSSSSGDGSTSRITLFGRPMRSTNLSCGGMSWTAASWANRREEANTFSGTPPLEPEASTISALSAVPAYKRFNSASSCWARDGKSTQSPWMTATRTQPRGPSQGMSETIKAAEAALMHAASVSCIPSAHSTEWITWVS
mmetsp:Transcript_31289/g.43365  ORF Transcript_31289/g.43365 Transcript_31289/m.43365 type:complete len:252 (+) Transcript_31289:1212-1967(+)